MRAFVRFRLPDGAAVELGHGDIIGRLWSAAAQIADARVSEAHAMVSLRGQELTLLALRGRFAVDGLSRSSLPLATGQRIALAEGLELVVEEVTPPAAVFAIEAEGLPRMVVMGVCSILTRPRPELVPRLVPDAPARVFGDGEHWRLSIGGVSRTIAPGDTWTLDGIPFRAVAMSLDPSSQANTRLDGGVARPLRVIASFETVHVYPRGGDPLVLSGLAARLVSEVVAFARPVPWEILARELWPEEDDPHLLRHKLDVNLSRLRAKLREGGVRPDVVRSDGFGHVELFLHEGDEIEDRA